MNQCKEFLWVHPQSEKEYYLQRDTANMGVMRRTKKTKYITKGILHDFVQKDYYTHFPGNDLDQPIRIRSE